MKTLRRELRANQTTTETLLWKELRGHRFLGLRFLRQYSVGRYILDFYCPERALAIELDGSQHLEAERATYDEERTRFLETKGIRVLRFWNNQVTKELPAVLESIRIAAGEGANPSAAHAAPPLCQRGGGSAAAQRGGGSAAARRGGGSAAAQRGGGSAAARRGGSATLRLQERARWAAVNAVQDEELRRLSIDERFNQLLQLYELRDLVRDDPRAVEEDEAVRARWARIYTLQHAS